MSKEHKSGAISLFTANAITTVSITMVLVLLGLAILVSLTNKSMSNLLKDNFGFSIEVAGDTPQSQIFDMQRSLQQNPYVKKFTYVSKDEVKKQLVTDLGIDPSLMLGYDPTVSYFIVNIKGEFVNKENLDEVKSSLGDVKIIENVSLDEDDIKNINDKLSIASYILLFLTLLMVVISFVLIRSIIQLNIYSKRFLINTMQLVGAKNSFIRSPFMKSMLVCGILAGILASCFLLALIYYSLTVLPDIVSIINVDMLIITIILVFVAGIGISLFATATTVNRYLKMTTDKLYKI